MTWNKEIRYCKVCGKQLCVNQAKYCSSDCFHKALTANEKIYKCKVCGKEIRVTGKVVRTYCSNECSFTDRKGSQLGKNKPFVDGRNRPFTKDTRYFIRLWYSQGDSKARIAQALGRSLKNIEQAFV